MPILTPSTVLLAEVTMSIPNWQLPDPINEIRAVVIGRNAIPQWEPFVSMRGPLLTRQTVGGKFVRRYVLQ